jgi:hypothetical protein
VIEKVFFAHRLYGEPSFSRAARFLRYRSNFYEHKLNTLRGATRYEYKLLKGGGMARLVQDRISS